MRPCFFAMLAYTTHHPLDSRVLFTAQGGFIVSTTAVQGQVSAQRLGELSLGILAKLVDCSDVDLWRVMGHGGALCASEAELDALERAIETRGRTRVDEL